jgi:hypothetical protein
MFIFYCFKRTTGRRGRSTSNKASLIFNSPLELPYYNDFTGHYDEWYFHGKDWLVVDNNTIDGVYYDEVLKYKFINNYFNYHNFSPAELRWFSIPDTCTNVTLRMKVKNLFKHIYNKDITNLYFLCFLEITKDRRYWEKILYLNDIPDSLTNVNISLNDYIGEDFVQLRIRIHQSSGSKSSARFVGNFSFDEIGIDFHPADYNDVPTETYNSTFNLSISPNPSKGIFNIETRLIIPYEVYVYNMNGEIVFQQENFSDGELNLTYLKKGSYISKVTSEKTGIAKKIIIN